jgi:hypothetical protein
MTKGERIIELLKKVETRTIWGLGIERAVNNPDAYKVMDLVIDLRSQARDNGPVMRDILGDEAFDAIMTI